MLTFLGRPGELGNAGRSMFLVGAVFALLGMPQLVTLAAVPAGLMFSTAFYVSLLFTYQGCFGSDETQADGAPTPE